MNTKTLKGMGAAASLLVGIGTASPALADIYRPAIIGPRRTTLTLLPSTALIAALSVPKPGCPITTHRSMVPLRCNWCWDRMAIRLSK